VTLARGIHFSSLGHSVPRPLPLEATQSLEDKGKPIEHKRLELLPEEALYLIERGTLACSVAYDENQAPALDNVLPPMSVQQAYADMVGTVDLTLEKYQVSVRCLPACFRSSSCPQVYAYLKRLGYAVTRANPPTPAYPVYQRSKTAVETDTPRGWLRSIIDLLLRPYTTLARSLRPKSTDWWYPISMARLRPASPGLFLCLFSSNHTFDGVHSVAVSSSPWSSRSSRTQRSSKPCIGH
jgi:tRNA-splicing endonuclease subunit Sen54